FEPRFGRSFDGVRVHAGGTAAEAASSIDAKAFTIGQTIAFGAGEYAPESQTGRELLAHELVHVVQQRRGPAVLQRQVPPTTRTAPGGRPPTLRPSHYRLPQLECAVLLRPAGPR